jgi:hypothetical protein
MVRAALRDAAVRRTNLTFGHRRLSGCALIRFRRRGSGGGTILRCGVWTTQSIGRRPGSAEADQSSADAKGVRATISRVRASLPVTPGGGNHCEGAEFGRCRSHGQASCSIFVALRTNPIARPDRVRSAWRLLPHRMQTLRSERAEKVCPTTSGHEPADRFEPSRDRDRDGVDFRAGASAVQAFGGTSGPTAPRFGHPGAGEDPESQGRKT